MHVPALRWQIAQKLHAVSEAPLKEAGENVRFWDLIDLQLKAVTNGKLSNVREACAETFRLRVQHTWPTEITVYPSWSGRDLSAPAGRTLRAHWTTLSGARRTTITVRRRLQPRRRG